MLTRRDRTESPAPALCTDGPLLCRVRLLSDAQWAALPEAERPARAERVAGLGWVVALPLLNLN